MLDLYTCYFPAAETTTLTGFINWYTTPGTKPLADVIAKNKRLRPR